MNVGRYWRRKHSKPSETSAHPTGFVRGTEYFTFSFSFDERVNLDQLASRLLSAGLAETANRPDERVRVSRRFRELARTRDAASDLLVINKWIESSQKSEVPLTWRQRWLLTRTVTRALVAKARPTTDANDREQPVSELLHEVSTHIDDSMEELQLLGGLRSAIDVDLLSPRYWRTAPAMRLLLRPFYARLSITPGDGELVRCHVYLLIHESGTCQLTMELPIEHPLDADELLLVSRSQAAFITDTRVPSEALTVAQTEGTPRGQWSELEEGTHWLTTHFDEPIEVEHVFDLYRETIVSLAGVSSEGHWLCYTTTFATPAECCTGKELWIHNHSLELAALTLRSSSYAIALRDKTPVSSDLSDTRNRALFVSPGSALELNWTTTPADRSIPDELHLVTPLEMVLLQYWQLVTLDARSDTALARESRLSAVHRELSAGLQEYERAFFNNRDSQRVGDELQRELRLDRIYNRVDRRIELLAQYSASVFAKRSARRASLLSWLAVLFAIIFGIPSIAQGLDQVKKAGAVDALTGASETEIASLAIWVFLIALVTIVVVFGVVFWPSRTLLRRPLSRWSARQPGFEWRRAPLHVRIDREWKEQEKLSASPRTESTDKTRPTSRWTKKLLAALGSDLRDSLRV
ncbi:hypothetical protein ACU610_18250 [Geodermatophilus sp. URMC 61]|uniref:hypothetical protein n=1 Tax=Geodermatophilus sp. URMC 61 TaxID=3423411 RepID=UPI00406C266D